MLPLNDSNFTWERFEEFTHHFVSLLPGVTRCHRYGTRGSEQSGIDLVATMKANGEHTYQCRQYKNFTVKDVKKAISESSYKASRHTIVVPCVVGTPVRDEIRKHRQWRLLDATDIGLNVRKMDAEDARILVASHFGPEWAEEFLGVKALATFTSPGLHYKQLLSPAKAFHHTLPLVGRKNELDSLGAFVESPEQKVYLLSGIGGSGKSRLVVEMAQRFGDRHLNWHLRVVTDGVAVTAIAARELPVGNCLIVVEDAHRRSDIGAILSLAVQRPGSTKVVLVARTHAVRRLHAEISWANLSQLTVTPNSLVRLGQRQLVSLAEEALSAPYQHHAEQLAGAVGDSPLVLIVAAYFLQNQTIDPRLLAHHDEFRKVVLDRFEEEATASFVSGGTGVAQKLLRLVSALQPIPADATEFHRTAAEFIGIASADVARMLGELEVAGVLVRRGGLVRIVPDVLADHILHSASVTPAGASTGYADSVFDAFLNSYGASVLKNLAELDWRLRTTTSGTATILDDVWRKIRTGFKEASHVRRGTLLDSLKEVASFQPERMLELIDYAIANPSVMPETGPFAEYFAAHSSHSKVLQRIPSVLFVIAHNFDYLPRCLEILWELGKADARAIPPSTRGHAIQVLVSLAEYEPNKPLAFQLEVLNAVEKWLDEPGIDKHPQFALDVLDAMLARTGVFHRSAGTAIRIGALAVDRSNAGDLRDRAIKLLRRHAQSDKPRVVLRVIHSLTSLLAGIAMPLGLSVDDDFYSQWGVERDAAFDIFASLAKSEQPPLVKLRVKGALLPFANSRPPTSAATADSRRSAETAAQILRSVREDYPLRLFRELRQPDFWDEVQDDGDSASSAKFEQADVRRQERRRKLVAEFLDQHNSAGDIMAAVASALAAFRECGLEPEIGQFLFALGQANPELAFTVAAMTVTKEQEDFGPHLDTLLFHAPVNRTSDIFEIAKTAAAAASPAIRCGAALHLLRRIRCEPSNEEVALLQALVNDADAMVRCTAFRAIIPMREADPRLSLEIALAAKLDDAEKTCHDFFLWLVGSGTEKGAISVASDSQLILLAEKLVALPTLDEHWVLEFLGFLSVRVPETVLDLLFARMVHRSAAATPFSFQAVPMQVGYPLSKMSNHPRVRDLLGKVTQAFATATGVERDQLARIFEGISAHFSSSASMDLLSSMSRSGDAATIKNAAALFRGAGQNVFFSHLQWVIEMLKNASAISDQCFQDVKGYLHSAATQGARMGVFGTPFPQDVDLKNRSNETAHSLLKGSKERAFFESLVKHADLEIDQSRRDGELADE